MELCCDSQWQIELFLQTVPHTIKIIQIRVQHILRILIIRTKEMHYFSNLFWNRTLRVSDRFTVHQQEPSTVYTAKGICHTNYVDCLIAGPGSILTPLSVSINCMTNIFCRVYSTRLLLMDSKPPRALNTYY